MNYYKERLASFEHPNWPTSNPVSPEALAAAYQYYTGEADETRCYYCNRRLRGWKQGDDPVTEHQKCYPECSLSKESSYEESVGQTDAVMFEDPEEPHSPQIITEHYYTTEPQVNISSGRRYRKSHAERISMRDYPSRLETFHHPSWPQRLRPTTEDLALAGQFYVGRRDETACYICHRRLVNWEDKDDPYEEHKRHYPECKLSQREKVTDDFINLRTRPVTPEGRIECDVTIDEEPDYKKVKKEGVDNPKCKRCETQPCNYRFRECDHVLVCKNCAEQGCPKCDNVLI